MGTAFFDEWKMSDEMTPGWGPAANTGREIGQRGKGREGKGEDEKRTRRRGNWNKIQEFLPGRWEKKIEIKKKIIKFVY